jgi:hypothetical protein
MVERPNLYSCLAFRPCIVFGLAISRHCCGDFLARWMAVGRFDVL